MSGRVVQLEPKARVVHLIQYGRECCKWLVKLSSFIDLYSTCVIFKVHLKVVFH